MLCYTYKDLVCVKFFKCFEIYMSNKSCMIKANFWICVFATICNASEIHCILCQILESASQSLIWLWSKKLHTNVIIENSTNVPRDISRVSLIFWKSKSSIHMNLHPRTCEIVTITQSSSITF